MFSSVIYGNSGDHLRTTLTKRAPLGTKMIFEDGREFVYCKAGETDLAIGRLMQQAVVVTNHLKDLVVAVDAVTGLAPAIGDTAVTITNGGTAITKDQYADGYLFVNSSTGAGQVAQIKSHPAESTGSGSCKITLYKHDALVTALTTSSRVGLRLNKYDGVIVAPIAETGAVLGVTPRAIDVSVAPYLWLQVRGTCAILTNSTVVVGEPVCRGATTDGSIDAYNVAGSTNIDIIGTVESVAASAEYSLIDLRIR